MDTKICTKCSKEKDIDGFRLRFYKKYGKCYSNSRCKECEKNDSKKYRQENRCGVLLYKKAYRESHKQEIKNYNKNYKIINKDYINNLNRKWRFIHPECNKNYWMNNKGKILAIGANRRARKLNQTPVDADLDKIELFYLECERMNKENNGKVKWEVDHIKPLSKGGLHHEDNLQILTAKENRRKGNKWDVIVEENQIVPRLL